MDSWDKNNVKFLYKEIFEKMKPIYPTTRSKEPLTKYIIELPIDKLVIFNDLIDEHISSSKVSKIKATDLRVTTNLKYKFGMLTFPVLYKENGIFAWKIRILDNISSYIFGLDAPKEYMNRHVQLTIKTIEGNLTVQII